MVTVKLALSQIEEKMSLTSFERYALLAHVLNKTVTWLKTWPEHNITEEEFTIFSQLCLRRAEGEPLAYILGVWAFWSFNLNVTPATLIPRPETEEMVEWILSQFDQQPRLVLDLGTGSGAIALALALERPQWQITATDFSSAALNVAQQNAANLHLKNIKWYEGSWLQALPQENLYHIIVSNPPYIAEADPHLMGDGVRFEPSTALVAAEQGLGDLKTIIDQGAMHLLPDGWLVVEHGYNHGADVRLLFQEKKYKNIQTVQDYNQQERFTYGQQN